MLFWTISENLVSAQSIVIEMTVQDLKEIDRRLQEYEILKKIVSEQQFTIGKLEEGLSSEKKINELNERELDLQKRIIDVQKMEIETQKRAFADMKEVADRSLKLAEVSKPKSNWQLQGLLGLAAFVIGVLIAK